MSVPELFRCNLWFPKFVWAKFPENWENTLTCWYSDSRLICIAGRIFVIVANVFEVWEEFYATHRTDVQANMAIEGLISFSISITNFISLITFITDFILVVTYTTDFISFHPSVVIVISFDTFSGYIYIESHLLLSNLDLLYNYHWYHSYKVRFQIPWEI